MAHPVTLLRQATVALLVAASTPVGANVFDTRITPYRRVELPAINVRTNDEAVDISIEAPREYERKRELVIEIAVALADGFAESAEEIMQAVETAINNDIYLAGTAGDTVLKSIKPMFDSTGEVPSVVTEMHYEAVYRTDAVQDGVTAGVLTPFTGVDATWNLGNAVDPGNVAGPDDIEVTP